MHRLPFSARTRRASGIATILGLLACATSLAPVASADRVYHSQHLVLTPVGSAPLRSGFVENIKAEGPMVYAHELFVLTGASPFTTYTVVRNFFYLEPECSGDAFVEEVTDLPTTPPGTVGATSSSARPMSPVSKARAGCTSRWRTRRAACSTGPRAVRSRSTDADDVRVPGWAGHGQRTWACRYPTVVNPRRS